MTDTRVALEGAELLEYFITNTVLVSVCRYISGNSSVPFSEQVDEVIGELHGQIDPNSFVIMDGDKVVAQIHAVYKVGEGFYGRIHIEGWLEGPGKVWGQWVVSK